MVKIFKVSLLLVTFFGLAGSALAQEASSAKKIPSTYARFENEPVDNTVMNNLAKIKENGIGYRFSEGGVFGVTVKRGIQVGFKIRF